ncbi:hypothetical protein BX600DRAFT_501183 [Xylariales sp. PMI_506]|nr:hypothetical protein BX600DRAFT_501183 [Xylariales sp. PMI_506]
MMYAAGTVYSGFQFEIKRNYDFGTTGTHPMKRIPLQWVNAEHFDEQAILNRGKFKIDNQPVCGFEASAYKIEVPEKNLNMSSGKKIRQRNCQTWIIESADQLVRDGIFNQNVTTYLHKIED